MKELQYALLNGVLVSINEVKNGLRCGCVCPACGAKLIARQGQKVAYHFAHYKISDCGHGKETALHLLGKKIIKKGRVFVPAKPGTSERQGSVHSYSEAIEEMYIESVKPDVLLKSESELLAVEIKVHHAVDYEKKFKIYELGLPMIEIDLSDIDDYTEESVEQIILNGEKTKWVYNVDSKRYFMREWFGDSIRTRDHHSYVEHCPLDNGNKAYLFSGSSYTCHDCSYGSFDWIYFDHVLCAGKLKGVDYMAIERILSIVKVQGQLKSFDVVINGEEIHREFDVYVTTDYDNYR